MSEIVLSKNWAQVRPQPSPRISKSELTRAAIMNAALEFLWRHPFREMNVQVLMAHTSAGRSTFYQYFQNMHELMETLLDNLEQEILDCVEPWLQGTGNPLTLLERSLADLVRVCYEHGPFLRALDSAAGTDERLDRAWASFLERFDEAVILRIVADQAQELIAEFEARPVAVALNRMNAATVIHAFGQHPRAEPEPVLQAISRLWKNTLYNNQPSSNDRR